MNLRRYQSYIMYSSRYAPHLHPLAICSGACINVLIGYGWVNRAEDHVSAQWIPHGWENIQVCKVCGSWIWEEVSLNRGCSGIKYYFNSKLVKNRTGVWLLNFTPVPYTPKPRFFIFLNTQSWVKTIEYFHCTCMITSELSHIILFPNTLFSIFWRGQKRDVSQHS